MRGRAVLWGAAPWRRAPLLLLRTPGVFIACALATAVLAMAASSGVLFLSSAGTGALHNEASQVCPEASQPAITNGSVPRAGLAGADSSVRAAANTAGLPAPNLVAQSYVPISADPTDVVTLFAREGAVKHVQLISSATGSGVWVPQSLAQARGLHVGGTLALGAGSATVVGIYRDLAPSAFIPLFALPRYWCTWTQQIVPTPFGARPPPFVLTDRATLQASASTIDATWYAPTHIERQTVPQARAIMAATGAAAASLNPPGTSRFVSRADLAFLLGKASRERTGLSGAVVPIDVAGTLVAALLVAAAGAFWGLRRQREVRLLGSRGIGRTAIAVKAAMEAGPAIVLGTVGGWLAAIVLVRTLGPSSLLEPGAPGRALAVAGVAGAGALLAFGVLGARALPSDSAGRERRWLSYVPWELALVAASVMTYQSVHRDGAVHIVHATVQINPLVLAFPLLALSGAVLLLARVGAAGLKRAGRVAGRLPGAAYLAARRLTGTPSVAIGTLIGVAVPIGVLIYSAALSGSTSNDLQRKYETNVGAQYAFGTLAAPGSTPDLHGAGTVVSMIQTGAYIDSGEAVRVIGVDPDTFPQFAFRGAQLRGLLSRLSQTGPTVDALLVNAPSAAVVTKLVIRTTNESATVAIRTVGTAASFPGERNPYAPLLVVNRAALPRNLPIMTDRDEEVWTHSASVSAALAALQRDGVDPNYEITPASFLANTGLRPVTWIFGYLRALAYLTGLVAVTALAFAFTARTRRRALSYYLARRMGLSQAGHRRSIAVELGCLLMISWTTGVALAVGAVGLVYRLADAYPTFPPPPRFPVPMATIATSALATAAVGIVGTYVLQHLLDRIPQAQLLRT